MNKPLSQVSSQKNSNTRANKQVEPEIPVDLWGRARFTNWHLITGLWNRITDKFQSTSNRPEGWKYSAPRPSFTSFFRATIKVSPMSFRNKPDRQFGKGRPKMYLYRLKNAQNVLLLLFLELALERLWIFDLLWRLFKNVWREKFRYCYDVNKVICSLTEHAS